MVLAVHLACTSVTEEEATRLYIISITCTPSHTVCSRASIKMSLQDVHNNDIHTILLPQGLGNDIDKGLETREPLSGVTGFDCCPLGLYLYVGGPALGTQHYETTRSQVNLPHTHTPFSPAIPCVIRIWHFKVLESLRTTIRHFKLCEMSTLNVSMYSYCTSCVIFFLFRLPPSLL